MQGTCSKAFSLAPVIDVEVDETDTSFFGDSGHLFEKCLFFLQLKYMTPLMFFLFFLLCPLPPTLALLTPEAGVEESLGSLESLLSLWYLFFLSFLALSEGLESWAGVDAGPLEALESSPQVTAPCVWTLCAVV